jgi:hypothetical protein
MSVCRLPRGLSFAVVLCFATATALPLQVEKNSNLTISDPLQLTLSIDHESYSRISDTVDNTKEPHVLLTLHLRLRFTNQTDKVVKLDAKCILLSEAVIYDSPIVGPAEPIPFFGGKWAFEVHRCPYMADEKLLRLPPGESFEPTQEVKFGVVRLGAFHPPETLKPGKYFLKLSETTWWEIDGQDQLLKEKRRKPGTSIGLVVRSELMSFVVKGKPAKRRA